MAAGGGGSWKVAYADFVTAMMALFLVLWITNQSEKVKGAVESYFKNPWKSALKDSTGIIPVKNADVTTSQKSHFENPSAVQLNYVRRINEDLQKAFFQSPDYKDNKSLDVEMTPDGLLINFLDTPNDRIFEENGVEFTPYGKWVFDVVAWNLARYPSTHFELEGHTAQGYKPPKGKEEMGAWEVSGARANVARKRLVLDGVKENQIVKVSEFGDTVPLRDLELNNPVNERVTIMVRAGSPE